MQRELPGLVDLMVLTVESGLDLLVAIERIFEKFVRGRTAHGGAGGAIVNVSSRAAVLGSPGEWVHYAASKGALDTLTIGLAREVAQEGIRVNAVAVGLVDTDLQVGFRRNEVF